MHKKVMLLFVLLLILPGLSYAQEVEGNGKSGSAIFSPTDYLKFSVPVTDGVNANIYGFYIGNVRAGIALLEVPITLQKHFTLTPSYLFFSAPPSGLSLLTGEPVSHVYHETQFRIAGTFAATLHHLTVSDSNMYVRRFTPTSDIHRYRNRVYISHALFFGSYKVTPFAFDEVYHDFVPGKWLRRNWVVGAIDIPIDRHITLQPSYIRQDDQQLRSINFFGIALIIKTDKLFHSKTSSDRSTSDANTNEVPVPRAVMNPAVGQD